MTAAMAKQDLPQEQSTPTRRPRSTGWRRSGRRIESALRRHGLAGDVQPTIDDRGLVVSLVSRHVVFDADVADLSPRGQRVVDVLAPVLRDVPDDLRIDGHTNQVEVKPKYYATDWDLSAARAVTVLRHLNEVGGVPAERLSMSAFGHERPLRRPERAGVAADQQARRHRRALEPRPAARATLMTGPANARQHPKEDR